MLPCACRALPLVLRAVLLVFACAFLLYNLLSLSGGRSLCFLHLLCWHRVLCSCICFPLLVSLDTTSFSGLDEGLTSHTVREAVVGTLLGQNPACEKRRCPRALHFSHSDFAALP